MRSQYDFVDAKDTETGAISASLLVLVVNLIDLFTVSVVIFEGKHAKIYNKCMVKVGILMLYNLTKVDILKFL